MLTLTTQQHSICHASHHWHLHLSALLEVTLAWMLFFLIIYYYLLDPFSLAFLFLRKRKQSKRQTITRQQYKATMGIEPRTKGIREAPYNHWGNAPGYDLFSLGVIHTETIHTERERGGVGVGSF